FQLAAAGPTRAARYFGILSLITASIAELVASTKKGLVLWAIAVSGSFNPWPVNVQTIVEPSPITLRARSFIRPAIDIAEAGSQNIPSVAARSFCAFRISSSLHSLNQPPDSFLAAQASFHETGWPMRMAVATVSGWSTIAPRRKGAAPEA